MKRFIYITFFRYQNCCQRPQSRICLLWYFSRVQKVQLPSQASGRWLIAVCRTQSYTALHLGVLETLIFRLLSNSIFPMFNSLSTKIMLPILWLSRLLSPWRGWKKTLSQLAPFPQPQYFSQDLTMPEETQHLNFFYRVFGVLFPNPTEATDMKRQWQPDPDR